MADPAPIPRRAPDSASLAERLRSILLADARFNFQTMHVRVEDVAGGVRLDGWTPSIADRTRIERQVARVVGENVVQFELLVGPPNQRSDPHVANAVLDVFAEDQAIDETSIQVTCHGGVVTLDGLVDTTTHRRYAGGLCWWVPGVRDVVNNLVPIEAEPENDEILNQAIEEIIEKDPLVDRTDVLILSHGGAVTLAGTVDSVDARNAAEDDCWSVEGVVDVVNEIDVASDAVQEIPHGLAE
jgi:osmotically-inducible protein OsmY